MATQQQMQAAQELIARYNQDPSQFSSNELAELQAFMQANGVDWSPNFSAGRALGKAGFEFADSLALGLLPDEWAPQTFNKGEDIAGTIGSLASFAVPFGGAAALGRKGASMALNGLGKLEKGGSILKEGGMLSNLLNKIPGGSKLAGATVKGIGADGKAGGLIGKLLAKPEMVSRTAQGAIMGAVVNPFDDESRLLENGIDMGGAILGGVGANIPALWKYGKGKLSKTPPPSTVSEAPLTGAIDDAVAQGKPLSNLGESRPPFTNAQPIKSDYAIDNVPKTPNNVPKGEYTIDNPKMSGRIANTDKALITKLTSTAMANEEKIKILQELIRTTNSQKILQWAHSILKEIS